MRTHTHTTHRGHLAQVAGAFHQSHLPPRDTRGADGALCAVPGGRRPAGAAQAGTSCGLITEDGDPREQSSGPGQRVRRAPQSPAVPQASKERSGGGAGMGAPNAGPKTGRAGLDEVATSPCTHPGGLAGVGCGDSEGRVDLVSVLKDARGLAKKTKGRAGSAAWERPQLDTEKAPEGAQRAVMPPPGRPPGFSRSPGRAEGGLTGFSVTRGCKLLANTMRDLQPKRPWKPRSSRAWTLGQRGLLGPLRATESGVSGPMGCLEPGGS